MKTPDFNRHTFPPGGWQFTQPQTGWKAPTPTSSTFDQTVLMIARHRQGNMAIVAKHKLTTNMAEIGDELEAFTRIRLGLPKNSPSPPKSAPLRSSGQSVGAAAVGEREGTAYGIKRAAQGTAVVLDWLTSGGRPVEQDLANKRAEICVKCPKNQKGSWYTVAPAEIIRATLAQRGDLKLVTPYDDPGITKDGFPHRGLLSCDVCKCLNRLKVWCPLEHILKATRPEIMQEFPSNCWIARRDA